MDWQNKTTVKKGNIGEQLVNKYLEDKGFIIYEPVTSGAHGLDKFAMKDKKTVIYAECKAKARRNKYEDTGIDIRHYNDYTLLSNKHSILVFVFFIDEMLGEIYGNWLHELIKPVKVGFKDYPSRENGIIYFPLANMRRNLLKLTDKQVEQLKGYSTRNYDYIK